MNNKLTAEGLHKEYKSNKVVLGDVNFRIEGGHIYGLIAPNGSGKTTLMRCIAGVTIFNGQINYNGIGVGSHFNGRIVYSSLEPSFATHQMKVVEYLRSITILKDVKFEDALRNFRKNPVLCHLEKSLCCELSTGQKKIFQLFIDFLSNPEVILLDEPLNGLDYQVRSFVISHLLSLAERGKIIVISTHVFSDIESITNKVFIIKDGLLNFYENEGKISDIYDKIFLSENDKSIFLGYDKE